MSGRWDLVQLEDGEFNCIDLVSLFCTILPTEIQHILCIWIFIHRPANLAVHAHVMKALPPLTWFYQAYYNMLFSEISNFIPSFPHTHLCFHSGATESHHV